LGKKNEVENLYKIMALVGQQGNIFSLNLHLEELVPLVFFFQFAKNSIGQ
jgi:hypothetical protein